jgi:tetratricopeptide (TPR) repeat protein
VRTIARAYDDLDPATAQTCRQLAGLAVVDLDAAVTAAACALHTATASEHLQLLLECGLLQDRGHDAVRGSILGFSDDARAHAVTQDPGGDLGGVLRRALDWYLAGATAAERLLTPHHRHAARDYIHPPTPPAFPDTAAAMAWLDAHHTNLMAAVRAAATAGLDGSAWQLVHAMWPWWHHRQDHQAWTEAHHIALGAVRRCGDRIGEREILGTWGIGLRSQGGEEHCDQALELFYEGFVLAHADGDTLAKAQALHELGSTHHAAGRPSKAIPLLHQARDIRSALGYARGTALTDIMLGLIALDGGDTARAREHLATARRVLLQEGDIFDAARAQAWLGRALAVEGRFTLAETHLTEAHTTFLGCGSPRWVARTLEMLGQVAQDQSQITQACDLYTKALALFETVSSKDAVRVRGWLDSLR